MTILVRKEPHVKTLSVVLVAAVLIAMTNVEQASNPLFFF